MEWSGAAIALGARRLGENDAVLEVFARDHGRWAGLVHGGAGKRRRPQIETGNVLSLTWKARVAEQLGFFDGIDVAHNHAAACMDDPLALAALASTTALLRAITPERSPSPGIFDATELLLSRLDDRAVWPALYVRWEVGLLAAIGYGLDLDACAVTGTNDALTHVSPRSGRAVTASVAEPYMDRLLRLPPFLLGSGAILRPGDLGDGLTLTGRFLESRAMQPVNRPLPEQRQRLVERLQEAGLF